MQSSLDIKPLAVSINASSLAFQTYSSGVITSNGTLGCGTSTNHAVVAVGYNSEATEGYYIVRNSWGPTWGNEGYVNIGFEDTVGICGINQRVGYPFTKTWTA